MPTFDPEQLVPTPEDYSQEVGIARKLAERYRLDFVDIDEFHIDQELFRSIPADLMLRYGFVPHRRDGKARYLAFLPRVWAYLERDLGHPALRDLRAWYDRTIPQSRRLPVAP